MIPSGANIIEGQKSLANQRIETTTGFWKRRSKSKGWIGPKRKTHFNARRADQVWERGFKEPSRYSRANEFLSQQAFSSLPGISSLLPWSFTGYGIDPFFNSSKRCRWISCPYSFNAELTPDFKTRLTSSLTAIGWCSSLSLWTWLYNAVLQMMAHRKGPGRIPF